VKNPDELTNTIVEAVKEAGCRFAFCGKKWLPSLHFPIQKRAIIQKGWAGISPEADKNSDILFIDAAPHDWLFAQCSAVVHHGS